MKFNTSISRHKDGELTIRGIVLSELMAKHSFSEVAFLLLVGKMPSEGERKLFDMMLVACAEHGVAAPSAFSARVSGSVGNPLNAALAAGLLATGEFHGGAIEKAAHYFARGDAPRDCVRAALAGGKRLPGFGHKVYKDQDPRAQQLLGAAESIVKGAYIARARAFEKELEQQSGKRLPLNIDGALAALVLELGIAPESANGVFLLGRLPGIIAHVQEERKNEKPYRRLEDDEVLYTGT